MRVKLVSYLIQFLIQFFGIFLQDFLGILGIFLLQLGRGVIFLPSLFFCRCKTSGVFAAALTDAAFGLAALLLEGSSLILPTCVSSLGEFTLPETVLLRAAGLSSRLAAVLTSQSSSADDDSLLLMSHC